MKLAGDDPDGDGSFGAGCLYAVLGVPLAVLTVLMVGFTVAAALKGGLEGLGFAVMGLGMTAFLGLLTGWCAWRLKFWYGTALSRRLDREMEAEAGESARLLASTSATAPTAVPTRLHAPDTPPVRR